MFYELLVCCTPATSECLQDILVTKSKIQGYIAQCVVLKDLHTTFFFEIIFKRF